MRILYYTLIIYLLLFSLIFSLTLQQVYNRLSNKLIDELCRPNANLTYPRHITQGYASFIRTYNPYYNQATFDLYTYSFEYILYTLGLTLDVVLYNIVSGLPIITITEESLDMVDIQTLCPLEGEVEDVPVTSSTSATTTTSTATVPITTAPPATAATTSAPTAATGFAAYLPSFMLPSSSSTTPAAAPPVTSAPATTAAASTTATPLLTTNNNTNLHQQQQQQRLTKTAKTKRLTHFHSFLTQLSKLDETTLNNYQTQLHPDTSANTSFSSGTTGSGSSLYNHAVACILISYIKHKRMQTLFNQIPMNNTTNTNTTATTTTTTATTTTPTITGTLPNSYLIPADVASLVPPTLASYLRSGEVHSIRLQAEQSGIVKARAYAERLLQVLNRCGLGGVISLTPTGMIYICIIYMCICIVYVYDYNVYMYSICIRIRRYCTLFVYIHSTIYVYIYI